MNFFKNIFKINPQKNIIFIPLDVLLSNINNQSISLEDRMKLSNLIPHVPFMTLRERGLTTAGKRWAKKIVEILNNHLDYHMEHLTSNTLNTFTRNKIKNDSKYITKSLLELSYLNLAIIKKKIFSSDLDFNSYNLYLYAKEVVFLAFVNEGGMVRKERIPHSVDVYSKVLTRLSTNYNNDRSIGWFSLKQMIIDLPLTDHEFGSPGAIDFNIENMLYTKIYFEKYLNSMIDNLNFIKIKD